MERRNLKTTGSLVSDDAIEMQAMSVETASHIHDVDSASADTCKPASWCSFDFATKSSFADFVSYVGVRGVTVIVLLKVVTVIAFAFFIMGGSSSSRDGDFSGVTLVSGRPENLRDLIHEASRQALLGTGENKVLFTMGTQNELVYDNYIEVRDNLLYLLTADNFDTFLFLLLHTCICLQQFIISYPRTLSTDITPTTASGDNKDETENSQGESWAAEKDKASTISTSSSPAEIAATRALDRGTGKDPLSLDVVDQRLVVHRFALPAEQQQPPVPEQQFTILLNKFNTVKDHVSTVLNISLDQFRLSHLIFL